MGMSLAIIDQITGWSIIFIIYEEIIQVFCAKVVRIIGGPVLSAIKSFLIKLNRNIFSNNFSNHSLNQNFHNI
jgi:hypothetical protein